MKMELDVDPVVRVSAVLVAPLMRGRADSVLGGAGPALVLKLQPLVLSISILLKSERCLGYFFFPGATYGCRYW